MMQRLELGILVGVPITTTNQHGEQAGCVARKIVRERFNKKIRAKPFEPAPELVCVRLIRLRGARAEVCLSAEIKGTPRSLLASIVFLEQLGAGRFVVYVFVVVACVEQTGILGAKRQRQVVLDGMQEDMIAQNVALYGLLKGFAAAFQALEKIR